MPAPRTGLSSSRNLFRSLRPKELQPGGWRLPRFFPRPNSYRKGSRHGAPMRRMRRL